jgi:hypothetical protein
MNDKSYVFRESDGARFEFLRTETKDGRDGVLLRQDGWLGHVHVTPMALLANFTAYPHAVGKQHRPFITLPSDQPSYETLTDLTMEQKSALPARFHTPVWTDSTPGAFICTVCWVEGEMVSWPCPPALRRGWDVFEGPRRVVVPVSVVAPTREWAVRRTDVQLTAHRSPHSVLYTASKLPGGVIVTRMSDQAEWVVETRCLCGHTKPVDRHYVACPATPDVMCRNCGHPDSPWSEDDSWMCALHRPSAEVPAVSGGGS